MSISVALEQAREYFSGRSALITGGGGFIASHLAKRLAAWGAHVRLLDVRDEESWHDDYEYVQGDVTDKDTLRRAMAGCDVVFHCAGLLGVEKILNRPVEVLQVNLEGTIYALQAAVEQGVERFVLSSSSEIYGEPRQIPLREDAPPSPVSIYGVSKLAAEAYCEAYARKGLLNTTVLRYFNVYGPGQAEAFVIPRFVGRVARGEPPIIYGRGSQIRAYTYVEDAVNCTLLAAASEKGINETFNVGTYEVMTVADLAELVISVSGRDLHPVHQELGQGIRPAKREIHTRVPDISKSQRLLGYEPQVSLRDGVERCYRWYVQTHRVFI